jgi:hypothetical protein
MKIAQTGAIMPADKRPLSADEAPDTARVYERARPEAEGGMGRLDNEKGTPTDRADQSFDASHNKHVSRQINCDDVVNKAGGPPAEPGRLNRKSREEVASERKQAPRQKHKRD